MCELYLSKAEKEKNVLIMVMTIPLSFSLVDILTTQLYTGFYGLSYISIKTFIDNTKKKIDIYYVTGPVASTGYSLSECMKHSRD